jgi:hypothetical protein
MTTWKLSCPARSILIEASGGVVGALVGASVGTSVGIAVGDVVGTAEGALLGIPVGLGVLGHKGAPWAFVGWKKAFMVARGVGGLLGYTVGLDGAVGANVA